jgi:sulfite exporter TauE/SafE
MSSELQALIITAITIACLHTATGPDHYLPFIALSKSRAWSLPRTLLWTMICGLGHVASSVLLGLGGAAIGWSMYKLAWAEEIRGGIAAWALLIFGVIYTIWGVHRSSKNKLHKHFDIHGDGTMYVFEHDHQHPVNRAERHKVTPWVMFIIFALGPCEPMIPLLYFPAAKNSFYGMLLLIIVYTLFTLITMVSLVLLGYYGISCLQSNQLEKHMHSLAGAALVICGAGMVFLGW